MRCNACWRELEGQAISTTCGHLFCKDDATNILRTDAACPICDQVLSKSLMKPVHTNPDDESMNMAMVGISPQILMKSMYKSIMFYMGQKELEMKHKMNMVVAQYRQRCEAMQEKFTEKLEQVHTAYQKMGKRCQMMQQEVDALTKDKQELQEKYAEKSRQKRKLEEMHDQLRNEYESIKRSATLTNKSFARPEPDLFSGINIMDSRHMLRQGKREREEEIWPQVSRKTNPGPFELDTDSVVNMGPPAGETSSRRGPTFGSRQMSRSHKNLFTL
ncbi:E3 ubiquitin-protein ligase CCNB1IP1 homolog isoform X1 [Carex rostrata]